MIQLTLLQRRKLESVCVQWTPDTAGIIVQIVQALGIKVYDDTLRNPARSASLFSYFGYSYNSMCGHGAMDGRTDRRKLTIDEFILFLCTEVLV